MQLSELLGLGFNRNEAKVYLAIIRFGEADAPTLIKETKLHKNIVYDNLYKLIDRGLISYIIEDKRRVFRMEPAHALSDLFASRLKSAQESLDKARVIGKEIARIARVQPHLQDAGIFRGIQSVRAFYKELQSSSRDYCVFGAPQESLKVMGKAF